MWGFFERAWEFVKGELSAKVGWLFVIIGLPGVWLIKRQFIAPSDVPPFALFVCAALSVIGIAILVVSGGAAIYQAYNTMTANRAAESARIAEKAENDQSALQSLEALEEYEQTVLYQILMRGKVKFAYGAHHKTSLWQKDIVQQTPPSSGIFQVHPAIWEKREELIAKYKDRKPWP